MKVDLNADLGEGSPADEILLEVITSANIACGGHAGDAATMRAAVRGAAARGVGLGAHPSYPDRAGFGRRAMALAGRALIDELVAQIEALAEVAREAGTTLHHVKVHGALYNVAVDDVAVAAAIGEAVRRADPGLIAVALAGSPMATVFRDLGLRTVEEGFLDRGYTAAGRLLPREHPQALITDPEVVAARAVRMAREGIVTTVEGSEIALRADTLCVHADTPRSVEIARAAKAALRSAGIQVIRMSAEAADQMNSDA